MTKTEITVNQRIDLLIQHLARGRQKEFAEKSGIPQPTMSGIVGSRHAKPGYDILEKILAAYPDINSDWLIMGRGEMLRDTPATSKAADGGQFGRETVDRLHRIIEELVEKDKLKDLTIQQLSYSLGKPLASERAYAG